MGSRYRINFKQYDDKLSYEYQTKWLLMAVFKFIMLRINYELVDFSYRK